LSLKVSDVSKISLPQSKKYETEVPQQLTLGFFDSIDTVTDAKTRPAAEE